MTKSKTPLLCVSMPLPDIRNPNVRLIDGKLAGLSDLKRLGQVTFSVKNNKVSWAR